MAKAQAEAQTILRERAAEFATHAAGRHDEMSAKLSKTLDDAEQRIEASLQEALTSVRAVAGEVVRAITSRLISADIGAEEVEAVVDEVMRERHQ